ncbi:retropepsin-like aspartic protease family protein [Methylobrevis pamukkalensis]|uniref:Retroviral aspartyl protease n=1 Tax=Methylobrevis pamukkalensis TaxID=1439726 RepID=A0A1E3H3P6_9HYPH|nr:TIGR02281 family clan AA aspartic protease [Methylobrevis pamukkalensis]ODN70914.1 hypothetical protein A6302_01758 [Methylobrevis pamukkalensis]
MARMIFMAMLLMACVGVAVPWLDQASMPSASVATMSDGAAGRSGRVEVPGGRDGHYLVEPTVNGTSVSMMVDTGATLVALRESDARRLGFFLAPSDYNAAVSTANGVIHAARVKLDRIELKGIELRGVDAMVLPDRALGGNLLGMSFLGKLARFEIGDGRLVMEQ